MPFVNDVNWKKLIKLDFARSKNTAKLKPPLPNEHASEHSSKASKSDNMFISSENFSKFMGLESSVIHQGDLRVGLKDSERFEKCYLVLKKCAKKPGIYLFGFAHLSSQTPHFIINVNNVQKVDYKENEKSIHLSNERAESCVLKSDDLKMLSEWIKVLVNDCDFNQEVKTSSSRGHRLPPLPETTQATSASAAKPIPIKSSSNRTSSLSKQISDTGQHSRLQSSVTSHSLNSRTQVIYCSNINQPSSITKLGGRKNIAGQAASSVGSMQEHLFRASSKNSLGTDSNNNSLVDSFARSKDHAGEKVNGHRNNSSFENYSADSSDHMNRDCDGYINLDDCESGNSRSVRPKPYKLTYKSQSTDVLNNQARSNRNAFYKASESFEDDEDTEYSSLRLPQEYGSDLRHLSDSRAGNKTSQVRVAQDYINTGADSVPEAAKTIRYVPLEVISSRPSLDDGHVFGGQSNRKAAAPAKSTRPKPAQERSELYVDLDSQKTEALRAAVNSAF